MIEKKRTKQNRGRERLTRTYKQTASQVTNKRKIFTCNYVHYELDNDVSMSLLKGIKKIFPDVSGTHLVFIDEKSDGFVYNPVSILLDSSLAKKCERFISDASVSV